MKKARIDITGQRFGKLAVKKYAMTDKHGNSMWLCECDCGKEKIVSRGNLIYGNTRSCGCIKKAATAKRSKTHGKSRSRLYHIWLHMKARCLNKNADNFEYYGGRGIRVCDEWIQSFKIFHDWAMANGYADDLTIDRINVNGNYEPGNCRWATWKEQQNNKRNNKVKENIQ